MVKNCSVATVLLPAWRLSPLIIHKPLCLPPFACLHSATKPGSRKRKVVLPAVGNMSQLPAHMLLGTTGFTAPRVKRAG